MPDWLWYGLLGATLGSLLTCWHTLSWYIRRLRRAEQTCFLRWQALEEEHHRAWLQRLRDVQAACPFCGLASAQDPDDTFSA